MGFINDYRTRNRSMRELERLRPKKGAVDFMRNRIEKAIAMATPNTVKDIHDAFERLGSWDDAVRAAEKTCEGGRMDAAVDDILRERELVAGSRKPEELARKLERLYG